MIFFIRTLRMLYRRDIYRWNLTNWQCLKWKTDVHISIVWRHFLKQRKNLESGLDIKIRYWKKKKKTRNESYVSSRKKVAHVVTTKSPCRNCRSQSNSIILERRQTFCANYALVEYNREREDLENLNQYQKNMFRAKTRYLGFFKYIPGFHRLFYFCWKFLFQGKY